MVTMEDDWQPGHEPPVTPAEDVEEIGGVEPFIGHPGTCFGEGCLPEMAAGLRKASAKTSIIRGGPRIPHQIRDVTVSYIVDL